MIPFVSDLKSEQEELEIASNEVLDAALEAADLPDLPELDFLRDAVSKWKEAGQKFLAALHRQGGKIS